MEFGESDYIRTLEYGHSPKPLFKYLKSKAVPDMVCDEPFIDNYKKPMFFQ